MDATASPTYPHGFEVSLGGSRGCGQSPGSGRVKDHRNAPPTVMRVSCKLPEHEAFVQRRSRKGVGERPGRRRGQTVKGGSTVKPAPDRAARRQMDRRRRARQEPPWRRRAALVACGVAAGVVMASCGGSGASDGSHPTTTSAKSTTTTSLPVTSTTLAPTSAAVLSAYRAGWAAFEHALTTANPSDPELAATMVDPQLQGVKANLFADKRAGMVARGTFTLHPKITALSATTATVVDCAYSTAELIYATTGKPVPPVTPPENDGVRSTLVLSGSTWKVSKQTVTDGTCAPGS